MAELRKLQPFVLKTPTAKRAVAISGIGTEHRPTHLPAKDDEVIVAARVDRNDDRRSLQQVVILHATEADALIATAIDIAFEVEQRKPLTDAHQLRRLDVFRPIDQLDRNLALGQALAVLVVENDADSGSRAADVEVLHDDIAATGLDQTGNRPSISHTRHHSAQRCRSSKRTELTT